MRPYSVETIGQIANLNLSEILNLINTEGVSVFDPKTNETIGYIPTLNSFFRPTQEQLPTITKNIKKEWYNLDTSKEITIITMKDLHNNIPVTSLMTSEIWDEILTTNHECQNTSVLLPSALKTNTLFLGEEPLINRLNKGFPSGASIFTLTEKTIGA